MIPQLSKRIYLCCLSIVQGTVHSDRDGEIPDSYMYARSAIHVQAHLSPCRDFHCIHPLRSFTGTIIFVRVFIWSVHQTYRNTDRYHNRSSKIRPAFISTHVPQDPPISPFLRSAKVTSQFTLVFPSPGTVNVPGEDTIYGGSVVLLLQR